jgi:hypothetical protein
MNHLDRTCFVCFAALAMVGTGKANAQLVTSESSLATPQKVIDFSQFNSLTLTPTAGPVQIGTLVGEDVVYTSTSGLSIVGNTSYGFGSNGSWNTARNGYAGLNIPSGTITFTFNGGDVSGVGGFINYSPGSGGTPTITALGDFNNVLGTYDLATLAPISTPGGLNAGAFRGITQPTANIRKFQISGSYIVLDNLTFTRPSATATPEPGSIALLLTSGLTCAAFLRCGKARKSA